MNGFTNRFRELDKRMSKLVGSLDTVYFAIRILWMAAFEDTCCIFIFCKFYFYIFNFFKLGITMILRTHKYNSEVLRKYVSQMPAQV